MTNLKRPPLGEEEMFWDYKSKYITLDLRFYLTEKKLTLIKYN